MFNNNSAKEQLPAWASLILLLIAVIAFISNYEPAKKFISDTINNVVNALIAGIIITVILAAIVAGIYYLFFRDSTSSGYYY